MCVCVCVCVCVFARVRAFVCTCVCRSSDQDGWGEQAPHEWREAPPPPFKDDAELKVSVFEDSEATAAGVCTRGGGDSRAGKGSCLEDSARRRPHFFFPLRKKKHERWFSMCVW